MLLGLKRFWWMKKSSRDRRKQRRQDYRNYTFNEFDWQMMVNRVEKEVELYKQSGSTSYSPFEQSLEYLAQRCKSTYNTGEI